MISSRTGYRVARGYHEMGMHRFPLPLALAYLFLRGALAAFTIVMMPYYSMTMCAWRSALFSAQAWAGLTLAIASATDGADAYAP